MGELELDSERKSGVRSLSLSSVELWLEAKRFCEKLDSTSCEQFPAMLLVESLVDSPDDTSIESPLPASVFDGFNNITCENGCKVADTVPWLAIPRPFFNA